MVVKQYHDYAIIYDDDGKEKKRIQLYNRPGYVNVEFSNNFDVVSMCFEIENPATLSMQCLQFDSKWNVILNNIFISNHIISDYKVYNLKDGGFILLVKSKWNELEYAFANKDNLVNDLIPIDDISKCGSLDYYLTTYGLKGDIQFVYTCDNEGSEQNLYQRSLSSILKNLTSITKSN